MSKVPPPSRRPVQKSAAVAERLEKAILGGKFALGDRLPSEAELGERFGASRTVIREALKRLNARGIVQTINGSGSYVSSVTVGDLQASLQRYTAMMQPGHDFTELFDLRILLEAGAAAMLAESGDAAAHAAVAAAIAEMDAVRDDVPRFADADINFHLGVVKATGNSLLMAIHAAIEPLMRRLASEMYRDTRKTDGIFAEHRKILDAITGRDPDAAAQAMRSHLSASKTQWQRFLGYHDNYPGAGLS